MTNLNRRNFLKSGSLAMGGLALHPMVAPIGKLASAKAGSNAKVVTIFLRGAMDGVHTVIPRLDPTYLQARANLIPASSTPISLFTSLNDDSDQLLPIYLNRDAAFIHQCGSPAGERSHFTEQAVYESATIPNQFSGFPERADGVVARLSGVAGFPGAVRGASVTKRMQQMYRGFVQAEQLAHVRSIGEYSLGGDSIATLQRRWLGAQSGQPAPAGSAQCRVDIENQLDVTSDYFLGSESVINNVTVTHDADRFPSTSTEAMSSSFYPKLAMAGVNSFQTGLTFMKQCEEAMQILLTTDACAIGVDIGAWDTHDSQLMRRVALDRFLAAAIRSLYEGIGAQIKDFAIVVVTEFGRTNVTNPSGGTDHGIGGMAMAFGPRVNGGVYNCHNGAGLGATWRDLGADASTHAGQVTSLGVSTANAQPIETDYRLVYAEMCRKLFGLSATGPNNQVEAVIPGWMDTNYLGVFN